MDSRFFPPARGNDCLNCKHGRLEPLRDAVQCAHPERPKAPGCTTVDVIRWAAGCPQHETKETT